MLSLVIPVYNRPYFLERLLRYYQELDVPYTIVLADSSDSDNLSKHRHAIDSLGSNLDIDYRRYKTDIEITQKLWEVLEHVTTPYIALGADDDFFIPAALDRAVEFLQGRPDYAVAHGEAVTFRMRASLVYGQVEQTHRYGQRTIVRPSGAERLLDHLAHYSTTWYSVHRTEQLRGNYRKTIAAKIHDRFIELLPSGLSLIQGKAKKLDGLYMVRQTHGAKEYTNPSPIDWMTNPGWAGQYQRFRDCLGGEMAQQDSVSLEEARKSVDEAFASYQTNIITRYQTNSSLSRGLRKFVGAVPGTRKAWAALRSWNSARRDDMSLRELLRPSSHYYADFMPVYGAITTSPTDLDTVLT